MKNFFKRSFLFFLLIISSLSSHAQLFPVQLTPVFKNPYSVKISDYATSMDNKMQLIINPTDIMISQRQVRLKLFIQGNGLNIQSNDYIQGQRPLFINGGELQTLTNIDIAALFRLENLQGISVAQYANGLPEGMFNFCFEMYDFVTNQKIAQKSCTGLYLILNDPPLLNTPQKNEQIAQTDFPNIMFTWTPHQTNATNVSYKFELKQLLDPGLDPQFAFQMSPVLYEETLFATALLYNLSMPVLTPGLRYAWRVQAISTSGLSENAIFKNDGYSEIYSFKYTQKCDPPIFAISEIISPTSAKISWQGMPDHIKYQVQYRKQSITEINKRGKEKVKTFEWFSTYSKNNQALLTNLEAETNYEFKVGSTCTLDSDGVQSFSYSNTNTFTIPKKENTIAGYNCGIKPTINIRNQTPLTNLIQSETFTAGDFPVTIAELKGRGPYSGKGYIIIPYLNETKIAVEFNDITINTEYQLINGVVETSYNAMWNNVVDAQEIINDVIKATDAIADLFKRAYELEKQKTAGSISEDDYNKNWTEIYSSLENAHQQYKILISSTDVPEEIKKKITDLDPVFVEMSSNNYTTTGNQNSDNLLKTNTTFDELEKFKCETSLKSIVAFLATEKVNFLKLLASETSKNTALIPETGKTYSTSVYDEENGILKITHYKGWSNSNPVQNLFLIETKDAALNKQKITKFWLSYPPNHVDGTKNGVDVVVYFKDPVPNPAEPFCSQETTIAKGVSTQAQFADAMEQMVFYGALGMGSVEALGSIKATECISGFTLDAGFQMGINAIVKQYLNESFTTKQLIKEVSIPSAATSCATAALVNKCGTACAGASGFTIGFGDDVLNQLKSGKNLSEIEISQSTLNGIKQGILNIVVQKVITFGIGQFSAWRGKYTAKQVEDALEDLHVHPEKYGVEGTGEVVKDAIQKKLDEINAFMKTPEFAKKIEDALGRYEGKLTRQKWEENYKTLYKNREKGAITEIKFEELMGSDATHLEIQTNNGKRYVDNVLNGVGKEIKSGKVTWSAYKNQVLKDILIIKDQLSDKIDRIEWHCFDGIDESFEENVKNELKKAGLKETDFMIIKY